LRNNPGKTQPQPISGQHDNIVGANQIFKTT